MQWHTPFLAFGSYFDIFSRWLGNHLRLLVVRKQHEVNDRRVGFSSITAELDDDIAVRYLHDNLAPRSTQNAHITLHGEEGSIIIDGYPTDPLKSVRLARTDGNAEVVPVPDELKQPYEDERRVNIEEQFLTWVMGGDEPTPLLLTLQQGLQSIQAAEGFVASMRQGGAWVDLPQA